MLAAAVGHDSAVAVAGGSGGKSGLGISGFEVRLMKLKYEKRKKKKKKKSNHRLRDSQPGSTDHRALQRLKQADSK
jgi:hypothetical protein